MKVVPLKLKDSFLSQVNPLRGLTMQVAVDRFEEGERGIYADLQWLYRFIEKHDATLRAVKRRVIASVGKLDWSIKVRDELPEGKQDVANRQEALLRETYERIDNLQEAIDHITLSEFRGYSHLEKHWQKDGSDFVINHLEPVPQWHWVRKGIYAPWEFVEDARSGKHEGASIDPKNFIIREIEDPINEIALICFVRKQLSQKDWDGFVELYGIPYVFIEMPPFSDPKERDEFLLVAQMLMGDSRGVLPSGTKIHSPSSATRGVEPFSKHLGYQDQQIVLAATSGLLTVLTESGSGTLAGGAHQETFDQIALALGKDVSEVFQKGVDKPLLEKRFPNEEPYAYFELEAEQEEDVAAVVEHAVKLSGVGYHMPVAELMERTGYELVDKPADQNEFPGDGDEPVRPDTTVVSNRDSEGELSTDPAGSRISSFETVARDQFAQALAEDLEPARTLIDQFASGDLTEGSVKELETKLSEVLKDRLSGGQTAEALSGILASAVYNAAEEVKSRELRSEGVSGEER